MEYFIQFVHGAWLCCLGPLIAASAFFVYKFKKSVVYRHSLGKMLSTRRADTRHPYKTVLYIMRLILLCLLALISARPLLVDSHSEVTVEGISIVLALDFSGSMRFNDFENDPRSRADIAKEEAMKFMKKRVNDGMGLVIFGNDAITCCPITHDKKLLENMIEQLHIGMIDPNGTLLATALVTAANRLKHSQSKSKVIILLTDGQPSEGDMNPNVAIEVAQKMGIKIYTIGIGHDQSWSYRHPLFGIVAMPPTIDSALLTKIAQETGGQFFVAHNTQEMHAIYDTIDQLEKTEITTPLFSNQYELGFMGIVIALCLLCSEMILSTWIWFGL